MKDADKTKDQLINELEDLCEQVAELRRYERIVETTKNPVGLVDQN
jgi:cell division protein FtsL